MKRNQTAVYMALSSLAFICLTALLCTDLRFFSRIDWTVFWMAYVGVAVSSIVLCAVLFRKRRRMVEP